ncbi:MAG TPA: branched-chain amino acid ABC transporter permease [Stellaceae bacterium]|nr:branched-chain amino acid ABC transporter permease [Stellaceae bacterium]
MLAQQLVNGLVLGSTYALFALGFTLIFGVLGVLNLTYGFYFSVGAFTALWAAKTLGSALWLALLIGAVTAGAVAVVIDTALLTPLRRAKAPELASLMVTLGATLLLYAGMTVAYGTEIRRFPPALLSGEALVLGPIRIGGAQILIVSVTLAIVVGLLALIRGTRLGLAIRALAERPDTAQLMGINAGAIVLLVSFVSGALGGAAGVLIGLNFNAIQPYMGEQMMLRGFAVIIIGGLGNIPGALLAGLLLGVIEVLTAGFVSSAAKDAVAFALLVLTLWFRPVGLFGRVAAKRA